MKYRSQAAIWKQLSLWTLAQSQYKHNCGGFIRRNNSAALSEGNQTPLLLGSAADVLVGGTIQNLPGIMKHESDQGRLQAAGVAISVTYMSGFGVLIYTEQQQLE